jgi:hypothetical protein
MLANHRSSGGGESPGALFSGGLAGDAWRVQCVFEGVMSLLGENDIRK